MNKRKSILMLLIIILICVVGPYAKGTYAGVSFQNMDSAWGMGTKVTKSVSNDRSYDWYRDQMDTGRNAAMNCGPTVIEMSARWKDPDTNIKVEEIVDKYIPDETVYMGAHYTDLQRWMKNYDIDYKLLRDYDLNSIEEDLNKGNIIIIGLDMKLLTYNPVTTEHFDSYFNNAAVDGVIYHYVIVKGYREVDGVLYFETYDPGSAGYTYEDGQPIGKDRYYRADEFIEAARGYFPDCIIIE